MKPGRLRVLHCDTCDREFDPQGPVQDFCPACGQQFGTLDCRLDYSGIEETMSRDALSHVSNTSVMRYFPLLPFSDPNLFPPLRIGGTPVYSAHGLADAAGVTRLWIKDDGLNPSGSYKDRASAMVVARARELGYTTVACASTGNAAASVSACCAAAGIRCVVFVPATAPLAKLTQIAAFGATLIAVDAPYDDAFDLCTEVCKKYGWFNRSAGLNPYLVEGKKTGAFELCEALDFQPPDSVFVSVGDGSIITGLCKGFTEFHQLGLIPRIPRVYGVQAAGSAVLCDAYREFCKTGEIRISPQTVSTCADSISVGMPREGVRAIRAVHRTGGGFVVVPDSAILEAIRELASARGVFAEPAAATAYAGFKRAARSGILNRSDSSAVFITGSGLKDIRTAGDAVKLDLPKIKPLLSEVEALNLLQ